ncbi:MAG: hypothetical protein M0020_03380 [Actinomycetota bacterium]|nr:hypothetical protein [Actinomycetota bacterium]
MKVTMLLCDAAQVADGKLYILGGGWSIIGPVPAPTAIAIKIDVPWHAAAEVHHWELFFTDADGQPVIVPGPNGPQAIEVRGEFRVGRNPAVPEGSPIDMPLAVNIGPLPLESGSRYTWRLSIDGETEAGWSLSFTTRPATEEQPS